MIRKRSLFGIPLLLCSKTGIPDAGTQIFVAFGLGSPLLTWT